MRCRVAPRILSVPSHIHSGRYRNAQSDSRLCTPRAEKFGNISTTGGRGLVLDEKVNDAVSTSGQNALNIPIDGEYPCEDEFGEHAAAFLRGNYTPVVAECTANYDLETEAGKDRLQLLGEIPTDFPTGSFSYVGPNPKFSREHYKKWGEGPGQRPSGLGDSWHHWFEGDGMLYVVDFKGKSLTYRNRFIRTESWKLESMLQRRVFKPLMNAAGSTFMYNAVCNFLQTGSFLKDSANTAIFFYAGKLLALQDTQPPWEIDIRSLRTVGKCTFDGTLPKSLPFTAHPKAAPDTGDLIFFGFNPVAPPHCTIGAISPSGSVKSLKPLWNHIVGSVFMHDFTVTKSFTVLFEGSMDIEPSRQFFGQNPLQYNHERNARFGLIPRSNIDSSHGEPMWIECESPQTVFHFVNAWEEMDENNDLVVVVIGVREDGFFHNALQANGARKWTKKAVQAGDTVPRLHEWRIKPSVREVKQKFLFEDIIEIPRINDSYTGKKNRYAYAGIIHTPALTEHAQLKFSGVIKFDLESGDRELYEHGELSYGMEAQFVPRAEASSEDDGWLIMYVHDETKCEKSILGTSYCVILDAKNISKGPLVKIRLPDRVPYGAHATWIPDGLRSNEVQDIISTRILPERYTFQADQVNDLLRAVKLGIFRGASGLFMKNWCVRLGKDVPGNYSFLRGLGFMLIENGSVGVVREKEANKELQTSEPSTPTLTLYDIENNGECKVVREALSILDLSCTIKPCPYGAVTHRKEIENLLGRKNVALPLLLDSRAQVKLSGADAILHYLFSVYADGSTIPAHLNQTAAQVALALSGTNNASYYAAPTKVPSKPLELWAYEASPFCAIVREKLCEMELPYVLRPCARGSTRRDQLQHRTRAVFQVPYLEDPNTASSFFESAEIVKYLQTEYTTE
jgi:carotenoid cleavage dioxygenase-like enzyme